MDLRVEMGTYVYIIYVCAFVVEITVAQKNNHLALCLSSVTYERLEFGMKFHYKCAYHLCLLYMPTYAFTTTANKETIKTILQHIQ